MNVVLWTFDETLRYAQDLKVATQQRGHSFATVRLDWGMESDQINEVWGHNPCLVVVQNEPSRPSCHPLHYLVGVNRDHRPTVTVVLMLPADLTRYDHMIREYSARVSFAGHDIAKTLDALNGHRC